MQRRMRGQGPQNDNERKQRHDGVEQAGADRQRVLHEQLQVLGDALVRVVGAVTEQLHAVVVGGIEPLPQVGLRHPAPPPDLQPLRDIELVNRENGVDGRQHAEEQDGTDESVPVVILQGIIKTIVPLVEDDLNRHERKLDDDHRPEQRPPRPAVVRAKVGNGQPPDCGYRRGEFLHRRPPAEGRWTWSNAKRSTTMRSAAGAPVGAGVGETSMVHCTMTAGSCGRMVRATTQ